MIFISCVSAANNSGTPSTDSMDKKIRVEVFLSAIKSKHFLGQKYVMVGHNYFLAANWGDIKI